MNTLECRTIYYKLDSDNALNHFVIVGCENDIYTGADWF